MERSHHKYFHNAERQLIPRMLYQVYTYRIFIPVRRTGMFTLGERPLQGSTL